MPEPTKFTKGGLAPWQLKRVCSVGSAILELSSTSMLVGRMTGTGSFSERHGFQGAEMEIRIREDAPEEIRAGIVMLGYAAGLGQDSMRAAICEVLLKRPDPNNWSGSNVENEVDGLVDDAPWFKIYDIAERIHAEIARIDYTGTKAD
ncbi:AbiJ-NTD4 domain-containing protein [Sphingomonas abaci]|uniref:HEPN AbiJ-N-terminal domain-containing protein n=1 Tax=Sphingomonas abaci TaxID=237611 RepID=A0A7W7AH36_9SPHN|nr:hypothetical protein [Sphingomonas abaci]MBB4616751.1 hypothetical protein [Sphingomonas abaci]